MDTSLILVKTHKGVEEIKSRSFGLSQTLRALLIMADGSTTLSNLLNRTAQLPKSEESIEWLLREGFVESIHPGERPPGPAAAASSGLATVSPSPAPSGAAGELSPKQALIALSRELLGPDAPQVIKRLEDAPDNAAELITAAERCHKFIKLTIDERKAEQFLQATRSVFKPGA